MGVLLAGRALRGALAPKALRRHVDVLLGPHPAQGYLAFVLHTAQPPLRVARLPERFNWMAAGAGGGAANTQTHFSAEELARLCATRGVVHLTEHHTHRMRLIPLLRDACEARADGAAPA